MIKYVESHAAKCGIPPQIADQLKNGHKGTEAMRQKVCGVAERMQPGTGRPEPERCAGLCDGASGSRGLKEGQHFRYVERQRPRAMTVAADLNEFRKQDASFK